MADLTTDFMGLSMCSPIVVGACEMTDKLNAVSEIEEAGAGAVVVKSLFEEQIQLEQFKWDEENAMYDALHPMMVTVGPHVDYPGPEAHMHTVKKIKAQSSIPVIASLNAVTRDTWLAYAERLQDTGVDALELNLYASPRYAEHTAEAVESAQLSLLKEVADVVEIPICVKLSAFYTNPLNMITRVSSQGVDAVVLFNRLFQPDIDPEKEESVYPFNLSTREDNRLPLRFMGLLHGEIEADLCANTGILEGADVEKMILAGANCVEVVSALYKQGIDHVAEMNGELRNRMERKGYSSLDDFRGKMSKRNSADPWRYTRAQYVNLLMGGNPLGSEGGQ